MTSIVDTHCHLDLPQFDDDREEAIQSALAAGVHAMIVIGFNPERWDTSRTLTEHYPFVLRAVGVHPNDANQWSGAAYDSLVAECNAKRVVAVGEIGLDYYRDRSSRETQNTAFRSQMAAARMLELPVIIHQRDAEQDVLEILDAFTPVHGVMHCFTGGEQFANACLDRGLLIGLGGVTTYPRSMELRAAIQQMPLDRLIVETDAPYLAPQRLRGKRNAPANIVDVVAQIAALRDLTVDDVASTTTSNAISLFGPALADAVLKGRSAAWTL